MIDIDKFFEKLSPTKIFIVNLVSNAFFWYLSIFLFNKKLIIAEQVQISVIIAFCFSFCWCSLNFIFVASMMDIAANPTMDKRRKQYAALLMNVFFSVFTLCIFMIIELYKVQTFQSFILWSFSWLGFAALPFLILALSMDRKRKKKFGVSRNRQNAIDEKSN